MVRTAIVQLLLFVAAVSAATLFVGVVVTEAGLYAQSVEGESDRDVARIDAEIALINHPEAGTTYEADENGDGAVTVYVKNVGDGSLEPADAELLLDGEYARPNERRVLDAGSTWREGTVLELTAPASFEPGDHRVVVEADGARDRLEFEHRIAYWLSPAGQNGTDPDTCDANACNVSLNDSDGELSLEMATDHDQPDESIAYASSNETVATVDPESGTTDGSGTNATTLHLHETGETTVELDVGWDADEIPIRVEE